MHKISTRKNTILTNTLVRYVIHLFSTTAALFIENLTGLPLSIL